MFISLSSERTAGGVAVRVADNGVGFDPQTAERRVGLDNATARLEGLLGARTSIRSERGVGTEIEIFIPDRQNRQKEDLPQ